MPPTLLEYRWDVQTCSAWELRGMPRGHAAHVHSRGFADKGRAARDAAGWDHCFASLEASAWQEDPVDPFTWERHDATVRPSMHARWRAGRGGTPVRIGARCARSCSGSVSGASEAGDSSEDGSCPPQHRAASSPRPGSCPASPTPAIAVTSQVRSLARLIGRHLVQDRRGGRPDAERHGASATGELGPTEVRSEA